MSSTTSHKRSCRVLIVDDEPALLDIYSTKMRLDGFEVMVAADGIEGFEKAVHEAPDVILLDVLMPGKDGFEVLKDLRGHPKTQDLPIVILSNLGQEYEIKRGKALGADDFLTKANLTPGKVSEAVVRILQEKGLKSGTCKEGEIIAK